MRQRLQDSDWADTPSARTLQHSQQQLAGLYDCSQPYQNSTAKPFLDRTGLAPRPNTAPHAKLTFATARPPRGSDSSDQTRSLEQQAIANGAGQQQPLRSRSRNKPPHLQLQGVMVVAEPKSGRSSLCSSPCSTARRRKHGSAMHSRAASLSSQGSLEGPDLQRIGRSTISSRAKAPRADQTGTEPELRSRLANASDAHQNDCQPCSDQQRSPAVLSGSAALGDNVAPLCDSRTSDVQAQDASSSASPKGCVTEQHLSPRQPVTMGEQQAAGISSQLPASDVNGGVDTSRHVSN